MNCSAGRQRMQFSSLSPGSKNTMQRATSTTTSRQHESKETTTTTTSNDGRIRLNKWLAQQGLCSRREADAWIARGWIRVNGQIVTAAPAFVTDDDHVQVHKQANQQQASATTIVLHKPLGIVSSQPEKGHAPAVQLLTADRQFRRGSSDNDSYRRHRRHYDDSNHHDNPYRRRGWKVAGRLDINSTGLLVWTQSGVVAQLIVSPRSDVTPLEKEYLVRIPASAENMAERLHALRQGVEDRGDFLQAKNIEQINPDQLRFVLTQGKYHHIRRMLDSVHLPVRALKRVRIGNVVLADLPLGQWRYLGPHENF